MSTKKDKKTLDIQEKLEAAKQMRLEQAERLSKLDKKSDEKDHQEEWNLFWTRNRKAYKETKEIGEIIWLHLKAIGCNRPEKFEQGIKNFGLKGDK